MARRLTRKEIVQEDRIYSMLSGFSQWAVVNRTPLVMGSGIVVVSLLGFYLWQGYQESSNQEAQKLFAEALDTYHAPVKELAPDPDSESDGQDRPPEPPPEYRFDTVAERRDAAEMAFEKISDDYSGTRLGFFSRYYLGLIGRQNEDAGAARQHLKWVVDNSGDSDVRNLSRNVLADIALGEEKHEEALTYLQQLLGDPTPQVPEQTVLMRLARTHEALGNIEQALENYRKITNDYPTSSQADEAQSEIDRLEPDPVPEA